ncbi:MAG: hypothetical protein ACR2QM_15830, partial [Longimicrobiales bacterium]
MVIYICLFLVCVLAAACSSSRHQANSDAPSDPVEVVIGFSEARAVQDVDDALHYLAEPVELDWGPGTTAATLGKGLVWEDAFGISFTLEGCDRPDRTEDGDTEIVRCKYLVESEVALAAGNESGLVCIDFLVVEDLIVRSQMLDSMPGCE